jgi:hypothetical protein
VGCEWIEIMVTGRYGARLPRHINQLKQSVASGGNALLA